MAMTVARAQMHYYYWFDNGEIRSVTTSNTGAWTWNVDASELREGFHTLHVMASPVGQNNWSAPRTLYFVKAPAQADLQGMTYVASVDNRVVQTGTIDSNNGTIVLDIDLATVPMGFHSLNVVLITKNGAATDYRSAYFWKLHTGGNHITRYEYWLNDGYNKQTVDVSSTANPLVIDGYLDLGEDLFTPQSYHFEMRGGKAYVFAKNTLTVRFYDAEYQSTEVTKTFVDYSVGGQLTGTETGQQGLNALTPGNSLTVREPAADAICWFQTFLTEGDKITLRTSRACRLEVILASISAAEAPARNAPRKAEAQPETVVYSTADASREGSFIAPATGTYFIALHDMTQQTGGNVQLTLKAEKVPTSIREVNAANAGDNELYDLQGRELPQEPTKGVYIKNRRKVTAK